MIDIHLVALRVGDPERTGAVSIDHNRFGPAVANRHWEAAVETILFERRVVAVAGQVGR